ncbi:glutamate formimidoyltransferase [Candidatus Saganbacteria bacterium]|nr:glutamate formimidoyltransferase [Candidatus Saganbacteria bacterium]
MIECVPNFSEGEDEELIGQIVSSVKTAKVLDVHRDPDHNRSVVTLVGKPEKVKQAAFDLTERALQLLDIREHQGVHPFIGVMDVIPFIPLKGASMQEAIEASHQLGQELWDKLHLPVYFYGQAAKIKERADLPYVRKGGYAALKREINSPHRRPDIGEGLHITGGAAAVGARNFLIAFNINLKSNDPSIAQSIAQNIRESHGGLKGVRALGLELKSQGLTQVSINITDHQETSLRQVFNEVKIWAKEYRVEILYSEIVGLVPQDAVFPDIQDVLKLKGFSEKKIIENNL